MCIKQVTTDVTLLGTELYFTIEKKICTSSLPPNKDAMHCTFDYLKCQILYLQSSSEFSVELSKLKRSISIPPLINFLPNKLRPLLMDNLALE